MQYCKHTLYDKVQCVRAGTGFTAGGNSVDCSEGFQVSISGSKRSRSGRCTFRSTACARAHRPLALSLFVTCAQACCFAMHSSVSSRLSFPLHWKTMTLLRAGCSQPQPMHRPLHACMYCRTISTGDTSRCLLVAPRPLRLFTQVQCMYLRVSVGFKAAFRLKTPLLLLLPVDKPTSQNISPARRGGQ